MDSFWLAARVVTPLLIYMLVGGLVKKMKFMTQENFKALNKMIFQVFIPLALFFDVYEADIGAAIQPKVFAFVICMVILAFAVAWILVSHFVKEQADATVMIQGIYRSNFVLFGATIANSLCEAEGVALVAALAAVVVPLFNILAVILFETKRGGNVKSSRIIINILKNPLVDAGVLGCVFSLGKIQIPELIASPLMKMGDIATPLALVTLGGMLSFGSMMKHRKYLESVVAGRLIIVPFAALTFAALLGFRGDVLVAVLAAFGSPTAVASAPMAQTMGGNGALAGEIVATTSVCCILTIFLFVFGMSGMGLI